MSQIWVRGGSLPPGTDIQSLTPSHDTGGGPGVAVGPDASFNVFLLGGTNIDTVSDAATHTIQINNSMLGHTAVANTALGVSANSSISGTGNTFVGYESGKATTTAVENVGVGYQTLLKDTTGGSNIAVGGNALNQLVTGSSNICLGYNAGSSYVGAETNNILIGSGATGTLGESNKLRIGGTTPLTGAYIQGIYNVATAAAGRLLIVDANHQVGSLNAMTNGQLIIGATGNTPTVANLSAGPGISITNAGGSITIAASGAAPGWVFINASVAPTMIKDRGYVCVGGGALVLPLPATAAQGDENEVVLDGAASWSITQGAGQRILYGNTQTTLGVGGSITSTSQGDSVRLLCVVDNLRWVVLSAVGNPTIV